MSGRPSRRKGNRGENEVAECFRQAGYTVERRGVGFSGDDLRVQELPEFYLEVRRRERLMIPQWCREIAEKGQGKVPVLIFRRSRERWHVCLSLEDFLNLLSSERV